MMLITNDDVADAWAFIRAQITGDEEGMETLVSLGDPVGMLGAVTSIMKALAIRQLGTLEVVLQWIATEQVDPSRWATA